MIFLKTLIKINSFLNSQEKRNAVYLLLFVFIGIILETAGVGFIFPIISVLLEPEPYADDDYISYLYQLFGDPSKSNLVVMLLTIFGIFYVFKNIYLSFLTWKQTSFSYEVQERIQSQIFSNYLYQKYQFHLNKNSSDLIRNITSEPSIFGQLLNQLIFLISESCLLIGILLLLIFFEPLGIAMMLSIAIFSYLFFVYAQKKQVTWGNIRQVNDGKKIKDLQEGLSGIKDVKIFSIENLLKSRFSESNSKSIDSLRKSSIFNQLPKFFLEGIAIFFLISLIIILIIIGKDLDSVLSVLAVYIAAAFRLLPSFNRIVTALQILKFDIPVIDIIKSQMELNQEQVIDSYSKELTLKESLEIKNLKFAYKKDRKIINVINLSIPYGSSIGITGESGSGKTTLVDLILGLLKPDSGQIFSDDLDIFSNLKQWRSKIGYVPQSIFLLDGTIKENILLGKENNRNQDNELKKVLKSCQLENFISSLPDGLNTEIGERGVNLSGGQKQRIGLARALYKDPDIIIFDEATSSLDYESERLIINSLEDIRANKTLIMIAHRTSTLERCDKVFLVKEGKIIREGTPEEILNL